MARDIGAYLRDQMPVWSRTHPGVEELTVAVMGCVVNGPGESKHADIGISLPGTFEEPVAPVFVDGQLRTTLRGDDIVPRFLAIRRRVRRGALSRNRHGRRFLRRRLGRAELSFRTSAARSGRSRPPR